MKFQGGTNASLQFRVNDPFIFTKELPDYKYLEYQSAKQAQESSITSCVNVHVTAQNGLHIE